MVVQTATVILNIVLAPCFIFGWGTGVALGVAGAALSTLVAIAIGVVWMVVLLPARRRVSAVLVRATGRRASISGATC